MQDQTAEDVICESPKCHKHALAYWHLQASPFPPINPNTVIENARQKERSFHLSCETPPLTPSPYSTTLPPDPLPLLDPGPSSTELVCIRKLAVRTNCPTAAQNPLRKALKGCSN
jgi:hypothetical protein